MYFPIFTCINDGISPLFCVLQDVENAANTLQVVPGRDVLVSLPGRLAVTTLASSWPGSLLCLGILATGAYEPYSPRELNHSWIA